MPGRLTFAQPAALTLLPLALVIYWLYRIRRLPQEKRAALWLIESGKATAAALRRLDIRLALLLLSFLFMVLALSRPLLLSRPGELVLVIDASASMAAQSGSSSRWRKAVGAAAPWIEAADRIVLVRAGLRAAAFGPYKSEKAAKILDSLRPGDARADLAAAARAGLRLLPGARVLYISDAAAPACSGCGYINVADDAANVGITRLGADFAVVYNSGRKRKTIKLTSEGEGIKLLIPAHRFAVARFKARLPRRAARLQVDDALPLDNIAYYLKGKVRVRNMVNDAYLARALAALDVGESGNARLRVVYGPPGKGDAALASYYVARRLGEVKTVYAVNESLPYGRGLSLIGAKLPLLERPSEGRWLPLVSDRTGNGLIWVRGRDVYAPPGHSWQDNPAMLVLLYNWLQPFRERLRPLGWQGRLEPGFFGGIAVSLNSAAETKLPRPRPSSTRALQDSRSLSPLAALLAAALLVLAGKAGKRSS